MRMKVTLVLLLASAAWAADEILVADGYPAVPNPIGFDVRLALIDWFHGQHIKVAEKSSEADLKALYVQHWDAVRSANSPKVVEPSIPQKAPSDPVADALNDIRLQLRVQYRVTLPDGSSLEEARAQLDAERKRDNEARAATAAHAESPPSDVDAADPDSHPVRPRVSDSRPVVQQPVASPSPQVAAPRGSEPPAPPPVYRPNKRSSSPGSDGRWITDPVQAKQSAIKDQRMILILFTGSDWCPWCVKLEEEILRTSVFKDWASDNFVLLYIDFPRRKHIDQDLAKSNAAVARQYGVSSYPTVLFVDSTGKQVFKYGYTPLHPTKWVAHCSGSLGIAE